MMNRKLTAFLVALMMIIGAITLSACGSAASDDPNHGVWNATTGEMMGMSMDVAEFFGSGFTIELKSGGKCTLNVDGEKAGGKWTLEDGVFTVSGGGFDGNGRLENGTLVLEDVMGMGLTLTFEKEGGAAVPASNVSSADTGKKEGDSLSDYDYHPEHVTTFEGDWFGVIYFESGMGRWESLAGGGYNVVARFAFSNGKCEAFLATQVNPGEEYLGFKDINAQIGTNGIAISGKFFDIAFENTLVRASADQPAIMYLMADDGTDGYDATLYLRPWGEDWSDSDPWAPTATNLEYVDQSTFAEMVALLGGDAAQIPAPTNVAGKEAANDSGPAAGSTPAVTTGSAASGADYFVISSLIESGTTYGSAEIAAMGMGGAYVLLHQDGQAEVMTFMLATGTCKDGQIDLGEMGVFKYTLKGDELTLDSDGVVMVFTRSQDAPPTH